MTIQIIRKNDRYWIRRKAFIGWLYYNSRHSDDLFHPFWGSRSWGPEDFPTYADAKKRLDKIIEEHVATVVEKISPIVVEDSQEL